PQVSNGGKDVRTYARRILDLRRAAQHPEHRGLREVLSVRITSREPPGETKSVVAALRDQHRPIVRSRGLRVTSKDLHRTRTQPLLRVGKLATGFATVHRNHQEKPAKNASQNGARRVTARPLRSAPRVEVPS